MKKAQIKVFEELLKDKDFKGKKQLKHLLWLNTSIPKFKVGQCVKVTNYDHRIWGHPVIDFKAKIINISSFITGEEWHYEMEMDITCGDKHTVIKEFALEGKLKGGVRNNKNILPSPKDDAEDATIIRF